MDGLPPGPIAYDNDYLAVSQADKVEDARVMSNRPPFSRAFPRRRSGRSVGVEVDVVDHRRGLPVRREHTVGGVGRVDLVVGDEAFEVKSSFVRFAARSPMAETEEQVLADAAGTTSSAAGHQLIVGDAAGHHHVALRCDTPTG